MFSGFPIRRILGNSVASSKGFWKTQILKARKGPGLLDPDPIAKLRIPRLMYRHHTPQMSQSSVGGWDLPPLLAKALIRPLSAWVGGARSFKKAPF